MRGVEKLVFPIFTDKTSSSETDALAIPRMQTEKKVRKPEFTIEFRLSHYPTAFDLDTDEKSGLPAVTDVSPVSVLHHPNQPGVPTVSQLLEQELTAFSKATDGHAVKDACNLLVARARNAGFSLTDRAMALYLAMNKTRASNWYETELENCTLDHGQVLQIIRKIWGVGKPPEFQYADARKRYAAQDASYSVWYETGVPFLEAFRKALTEPRLGERERLVKKLSGGSEIGLGAPSELDEWPPIAATDSAALLPELHRLAARKMVSAGCFTYQSGNKFSPTTNPGDLLMLDDKGRIWVASPRRSNDEIPKLASVDIFALDESWKPNYVQPFKEGYYGSTIRGGCSQISSKLLAP